MKHLILNLPLAILFSLGAQAAVGPSSQETSNALSLPFQNRMGVLEKQGEAGLHQLVQIMFDHGATMDLRWRAVLALGQVGGSKMTPQLDKALHDKEWFMRNAALLALETANPEKARIAARALLDDRALIVRSAAVDSLVRLKDQASATLLWQKVNARENFRGAQSLWIRRQIVDALRTISTAGDEQKFVALLDDRDESLQAAAIHALEQRTGQKLGKDKEPVKFRKAYWQKWSRDKVTL